MRMGKELKPSLGHQLIIQFRIIRFVILSLPHGADSLSFLLRVNHDFVSPQARSGLMREVSTELEKKLESRQKDRPINVTSTSQVNIRIGIWNITKD